jgi:hypothetical protein
MLKGIISTVLSFGFMLIPMVATAGSQQKAVKWNTKVKKGSIKAQRITTKDGKKILVAPDGTMYLLDSDGKHFMVDQNGQKIQVNQVGYIIKVGKQRKIKLRIGPGPLA